MRTVFTADRADERLDLFLVRRLTDLSRSYAQRLIADGQVTVDGTARKANYKLRGGEEIVCTMPPAEEIEICAEDIPLDILYEDADIIVVNKARGMVVHPAAGIYTGTLVNALLWHCHDLSGINGALRPGIVHRLDKDTSGVMVAAKNDMAHHYLARQIRDKDARREYRAIVHGNIVPRAGVITGAIGRHPTDRKKMAIVRENGKPATTHFEVLERFGDYTYVSCRLDTGRTHQIRVHMTSIGHPLVGDPKYTAKKNPFAIVGQALHSLTLSLTHPRTGTEMTFTAPLPADMEEILHTLQSGR
ncbi:RluA family pseudouridine synthase [uncultured Selenomonas sp.]|uniref:RluA family pseudouridine synthase n=1 Tax=uncultured Selenomonas sp. TaxID=159275 RepID=UPI0028DB278E|nr:RluA family pseudouridine synthase [uncultured Selenomonas sp.]